MDLEYREPQFYINSYVLCTYTLTVRQVLREHVIILKQILEKFKTERINITCVLGWMEGYSKSEWQSKQGFSSTSQA